MSNKEIGYFRKKAHQFAAYAKRHPKTTTVYTLAGASSFMYVVAAIDEILEGDFEGSAECLYRSITPLAFAWGSKWIALKRKKKKNNNVKNNLYKKYRIIDVDQIVCELKEQASSGNSIDAEEETLEKILENENVLYQHGELKKA